MSNKPENKEENKDTHKSRKVWKTLLRALGWTLLALVVLIIAAITVAVNPSGSLRSSRGYPTTISTDSCHSNEWR